MTVLHRREDGSYISPDDPGERIPGIGRVSITDAEGELLAWFARGCAVLEIGTGLGVSTRWLASTASSVVTTDIAPWVQETIWPTLPTNVRGLERHEVEGPFDLAFIDGGHLPEEFADDMELVERVVGPPGLIVAHDAYLLNVAGWYTIPTTHGLAIRCV